MMNQPGGLDGKGGVEIHTRSINNNHSRIVAESGSLDMVIGEAVHNSHAMIVSKAGAPVNIKAQSIHNNYSTISSNGALNIETGFLSNSGSGTMIDNNATGIISSVDDLRLTVGQSFTNYGWINSKKMPTLMLTVLYQTLIQLMPMARFY